MKNVMFALFALLVSLSVVNANPVTAFISDEYTSAQDNKVKIDPEELPDAVKTALNGEEYTGWQISAAYKNTQDGTFEIELTNGSETVTQKFDKEGNKVE